jgi:hypothetical protein
MKRLFTFLAIALLTVSMFAQSPQLMSYQAVVRNSSNALVTNQAVGMRISILQGSATGTAVYVETQTPSTNANGLASLQIGGGTAVTGTFAAINWATGPYYIKTETDPTGGSNYTIIGTNQMLSVPYAMYAAYAGNLSNTSILMPPVDTIQAATNIQPYSATVNGIVNGKGLSSTVTFEYGSTTAYGNSVTATQSPVTGASNVAVSALLTGLQGNTTYHYRIKAVNAVNVSYSLDMSFTTSFSTPQLTTNSPSSITGNSASSGGTITYDGGSPVTARGVCWSNTNQNPTVSDNKTIDGTGSGVFTSLITGLANGTTYYMRTYATNSVGTSYGNLSVFTTKVPQLTTTAISSITGSSASSGGNITYDGGYPVTARGVCWSTSSSPTIADSKTIDGSGSGVFSSSITGLVNGTKYYVRAYTTNSSGTSYVYGNEISFTTFSIPTLTTSAADYIKGNSAIAGGTITNNGGGSLSAQGLCWSTNPSPTIANSVTTSFTDTMKSLTPNTTYYVRAYATNPAGTGYGNQIIFNSGQQIGSTYVGGIVFYNDGTGHGLVYAPTEQSTGIQWYNGSYITTGATGYDIGTGLANTNAIIASQGTGSYAAQLCHDLTLNGYNDWYLPSQNEAIYIQKATGIFCWSSTELSVTEAAYTFLSGNITYLDKSVKRHVRAIRSF